MNELISLNKTEINNETVQTVNARDLHAFLESRQDFSTTTGPQGPVVGLAWTKTFRGVLPICEQE